MKKSIKIILIIVLSTILMFITFGVIDYYRAASGKKPIFIYYKYSAFNEVIESHVYYGVGYMVIRCDKDGARYYSFQIGNKSKYICYEEEIEN